jgi:carbamoyltransferase
MICIGISGLSEAVDFTQATFPGRDSREYRMTQGHDSAAAIVVDGEIVAAVAEERLSGQKHTGAFPIQSIRYCLDQAKVDISEVDILAHSFSYEPYRWIYNRNSHSKMLYGCVLSPKSLASTVARQLPALPEDRIRAVDHHLSHAASVYFTSGWNDSLVLVMDGMGEVCSTSAYVGHGKSLRRIGRISASNSIGLLYSLVTYHLGFEFNADEYKIMGLAPYGDADRYADFFRNEVRLTRHGIEIPLLKLNKTPEQKTFYLSSRDYLAQHLGPPRHPKEPITDVHRDIAASLQRRLEEVVLHIAGYYQAATGMRLLSLAGGVAMNCTANGKLRKAGLFDEIFISPASGDDGSALGAALACSAGALPRRRLRQAYLGPAVCGDEIAAAIRAHHDQVEVQSPETAEEVCEIAARLLAEGKVLAWHRGRMEFGARALGNRSILADPRIATMRDRVNEMVKKREGFRPFAPAVLVEEASRWFDVDPSAEVPFMTTVVQGAPNNCQELPAVTHVDGSARVQTVKCSDNPSFYMLIEAFRKLTGIGVLLNTSFNVQGQPIIAKAYDAIATYLSTNLDALVLENHIITRRRIPGSLNEARVSA